MGYLPTAKKAATAWNRRSPPPPQEAVIPTEGAGLRERMDALVAITAPLQLVKATLEPLTKRSELSVWAPAKAALDFLDKAMTAGDAAWEAIAKETGDAPTSTCGIAPLGDEPLTPTRGEAEPVAWESDVLNTISGMNQIVLSHHVVTPRRDERVRSQKPLVYASQPHAPDSWRPDHLWILEQARALSSAKDETSVKALAWNITVYHRRLCERMGLALQPKGEERS